MRSRAIPSLILGLATLSAAAPAGKASGVSCAQNATNFALIYGFPLGNYAQFINNLHEQDGEPNVIYHSRELSTADSRLIVRPNVDTLYSPVYFDLSSSDIEVTVPEIKDRYYVFPFYDFYGNNYANVGTVSNAAPGKYLVRFMNSDFGLKKGDDKYRGYINTPTTYGLVLVRISVAPKSITDQKKVNAIQDQIKVKPIKRPGKPIAPALDKSLFNSNGTTGTPFEKLLKLTARTAKYNQPEVVGDRKWVSELLAKSGMKDGKYTKPAGVSLDVAAKELNATIIKGLTSPGSVLQLNNGWAQLAPKISGNFYSGYWARAFVAWAGYLQVTADVALYPTWNVFGGSGGAEAFSVGPNEAYVFTFSKKPDLVKNGFWSLTAYGEDQYLIPNKMNTYILGDRSNLTYPDGQLVYGGTGKESNEEKQFQILVQPADVAPPSNWTGNWLPAPPGGGKMTLNLRFYGPKPSLSNGEYVYPVVKKQNAIRA